MYRGNWYGAFAEYFFGKITVDIFLSFFGQYPILVDSAYAGEIAHSQYFTGEYSTDQICCFTGLTIQQLENQIENNPGVALICK